MIVSDDDYKVYEEYFCQRDVSSSSDDSSDEQSDAGVGNNLASADLSEVSLLSGIPTLEDVVEELVHTVEASTPTSKVNFGVAVGDEGGNTNVPTDNWLSFLAKNGSKKIPNITKFNHFEFENSHKGVVKCKLENDGNVYVHRIFPSDDGPTGYKDQFTIVPVLVGSLSPEREAAYGRIFARYLAEPQNLFVISSDFCHWGQRFRYTYYDRNWGDIYQSITRLDRMAMDIIETLNPAAFTDYLKRYANTICGRHPIGVLLHATKYPRREDMRRSPWRRCIVANEVARIPGDAASCLQRADMYSQRMTLKFLKYAQSSQCENMNDSSVSYAAGVLTFE
ncbi:Protein memo1 [Homalodisca vitripennis]|nr:Protein memo1 [Homalodisca vitripennis]